MGQKRPNTPTVKVGKNILQGESGTNSGTEGRERTGAGVKGDRSKSMRKGREWKNGSSGDHEIPLNSKNAKGVDTDEAKRGDRIYH